MIISLNAPFRAVEDPGLRALINFLHPIYIMPSATTVRRLLKDRLTNVEQQLFNRRVEGSKISITLDCWTSPYNTAFLGVLAYYIDDTWTLRKSLIGFEPLYGTHSGEELAKVVLQLLEHHNITTSVHTITTDNASNNEKLVSSVTDCVEELSKNVPSIRGFLHNNITFGSTSNHIERIPCLAHIIQLALKDLLGSIHINPTNNELKKRWNEQEELCGLSADKDIALTLAKVSYSNLYSNLY
jgi:hypothetical protein